MISKSETQNNQHTNDLVFAEGSLKFGILFLPQPASTSCPLLLCLL